MNAPAYSGGAVEALCEADELVKKTPTSTVEQAISACALLWLVL